MGKGEIDALHDTYCAGYHNLPRMVKRHLSFDDMQEIWFHMVRPVVDPLTAELESLKQQVPRWVPVSERLPDTGKNVLFFWRNELGKARISKGYHCPPLTIEAPSEWDEDACDILDGWALWYQKPGWYEEGWEIEECALVSGVTHWMPLPPEPQGVGGETLCPECGLPPSQVVGRYCVSCGRVQNV